MVRSWQSAYLSQRPQSCAFIQRVSASILKIGWNRCALVCRYLYLSSNDYPRLFVKHLSYVEASRVALMSKNDDTWTRTSAR